MAEAGQSDRLNQTFALTIEDNFTFRPALRRKNTVTHSKFLSAFIYPENLYLKTYKIKIVPENREMWMLRASNHQEET